MARPCTVGGAVAVAVVTGLGMTSGVSADVPFLVMSLHSC